MVADPGYQSQGALGECASTDPGDGDHVALWEYVHYDGMSWSSPWRVCTISAAEKATYDDDVSGVWQYVVVVCHVRITVSTLDGTYHITPKSNATSTRTLLSAVSDAATLCCVMKTTSRDGSDGLFIAVQKYKFWIGPQDLGHLGYTHNAPVQRTYKTPRFRKQLLCTVYDAFNAWMSVYVNGHLFAERAMNQYDEHSSGEDKHYAVSN